MRKYLILKLVFKVLHQIFYSVQIWCILFKTSALTYFSLTFSSTEDRLTSTCALKYFDPFGNYSSCLLRSKRREKTWFDYFTDKLMAPHQWIWSKVKFGKNECKT